MESKKEILCLNVNSDEYTGEILFRRKLGKRLCFITLFNKESNIQTEAVIHNIDIIPQLAMGDVITIKGSYYTYEGKCRLQASEVIWVVKSTRDNDINNKRNEFFTKQDGYQYTICSYTKKKLQCPNEDCKFRHEVITEIETNKINQYKKNKLKAYEDSHQGDPLSKDSKNKKSHRNSQFANFIVETFGKDTVSKGVILDIAGGKGLTSFYLRTKYNLKTIIVDPRGTTIPKKYLKIMKKENITLEERKEMFTIDNCSELIKSCSLIIGMHPDEATELIVDVAIKNHINFAVVPCCVFHTKFPDRKLKNGKEVIEYNDLIEYLLEKEDSIKVSYLNIEGRNKVLYKQY